MFDLFSVTPRQLNDAVREQTAMHLATVKLLVERGIITEEEWIKAKVAATAELDQHVAREAERINAELSKRDAGTQLVARLFGKLPDDLE